MYKLLVSWQFMHKTNSIEIDSEDDSLGGCLMGLWLEEIDMATVSITVLAWDFRGHKAPSFTEIPLEDVPKRRKPH